MSAIGELLETLAPIGRNEQGGYDRLAWTDPDAAMRRWFLDEAASLGLEAEVDRNGNLWAHWRQGRGGALVLGSHLDSVRNGGALDGPLGVASAFAAIRALQESGETLAATVSVVAFVDEEGGRFGIACLGSRLMTGALDPARARALADRDGVRLDDAMRAAGLDPDALGPDPARVASIAAAVELHVEQGHLPIDGSDAAGLAAAGAPLGVLTGIWPHGRWRIDVVGQANHAGTTPMADRDDPVVGAAAVVLAAREAAMLEGALATIGRVQVEPGAVNAIAASASLWLDVRGADEGRIRRVVERIAAAAGVAPVEESWTAPMRFARSETRRVAAVVREVTGADAPTLPSGAGHDAGVLQAAGVAAAMLAVRNPTGVSHAPGESADPADIEVGVSALARLMAAFPRALDGDRMTTYWLERAVLPDGIAERVRVREEDGGIVAVLPDLPAGAADIRLSGLTVPGFANAHSHAFHRALRGTTHTDGGSFWTWREAMYGLAGRLTPDTYRMLATAVFAEMVLAGFTVVGEFHYLHRTADGGAYPEPAAMADAVLGAAAEAGIRITLLDTLYLHGGLDEAGNRFPASRAQRRFVDPDLATWAARHHRLTPGPRARIGTAAHSVRAVDPDALAHLPGLLPEDEPVHAHVSEQPAENEQVAAAYGRTPLAVLADAGLVTDRFTAVHATHLTDDDVALLATARATACICPTTEADLADGIGPVRRLADRRVALALGTDQHVRIDPFEELQRLEADQRLASGERGRLSPGALLAAATRSGYRSLGWPDGGAIEAGAPCDLVAVDTASPRTAGARLDQLHLAASAADVTDVVVAGTRVVTAGRHRLGDVGALLADAIAALQEDRP